MTRIVEHLDSVPTEALKEIIDSINAILPMAESLNSFVANNDVWASNRKKMSRATAVICDIETVLAGRRQ